MLALDDRTIQIVTEAFDNAWSEISACSAGGDVDRIQAREQLAKRILRLAQAGMMDQEALARVALLHFRAPDRI
jgi:hypothetical protein